ncbi:MAG: transmembrane 220 family protein [Myxococcota bacterium]
MPVFSIVCGLMGCAFLGFAWVQLNDADGAWWILAYGLVAALSFLAAFRRLPHRPAFGIAFVLGFALWWIAEPSRPFDLDDELIREELGLALAMGWTLVLAMVAQRVAARRLIEGG